MPSRNTGSANSQALGRRPTMLEVGFTVVLKQEDVKTYRPDLDRENTTIVPLGFRGQ
jgi:hypothetical protein